MHGFVRWAAGLLLCPCFHGPAKFVHAPLLAALDQVATFGMHAPCSSRRSLAIECRNSISASQCSYYPSAAAYLLT